MRRSNWYGTSRLPRDMLCVGTQCSYSDRHTIVLVECETLGLGFGRIRLQCNYAVSGLTLAADTLLEQFSRRKHEGFQTTTTAAGIIGVNARVRGPTRN